MNEVFGRFFNVDPIEMFEPTAYAQAGAPRDLFVFDDQLHLVRGTNTASGHSLRAAAQGPTAGERYDPTRGGDRADEGGEAWRVWNPALVGLPMTPANFQLVQFIKDVFLDSQVTVGLLSNVTAFSATPVSDRGQPGVENRPPRNYREAERAETITAAQTAAARDFVNEISGSRRMLAHGMLYVGKGNLEWVQQQIDENKPDSWKGYNISYAAKVDDDPNSLMRRWRHDDEEVAYPTFELIQKNYERLRSEFPGFNNICVHKGLAPGPPDPVMGAPGRHAQGGPRLAEPQLHHVSLLYPPDHMACRFPGDGQIPNAARRCAGHQMDHRVRPARGAVLELLRRDRDNLGLVDRDISDGRGPHHGTADAVHGRGPHRLRVGLCVVQIAAVADRRALAVPDP